MPDRCSPHVKKGCLPGDSPLWIIAILRSDDLESVVILLTLTYDSLAVGVEV